MKQCQNEKFRVIFSEKQEFGELETCSDACGQVSALQPAGRKEIKSCLPVKRSGSWVKWMQM